MIHPLNQPIPVPEETLVWALSQIKNEGQAFGLAVDDMFKHKAMRELQCTIPPKFAHYDLVMGDLHVEVKSTAKNSFTFSRDEYYFILQQYLAEKQFKLLFYVNDLTALTTTFIGSLNVSQLFEANLITDSKHNPQTQNMVMLDALQDYLNRPHQE